MNPMMKAFVGVWPLPLICTSACNSDHESSAADRPRSTGLVRRGIPISGMHSEERMTLGAGARTSAAHRATAILTIWRGWVQSVTGCGFYEAFMRSVVNVRFRRSAR